jgi:hypothetical protein
MGKRIEILTGAKFGKLTVIEFHGTIKGHAMYKCACECGKTKIIRGSALVTKNTLSCGCYNYELAAKLSKTYCQTHGDTIGGKSPEYEAYMHMKCRCYCKKLERYKNYGGRGITVCKRWLGENGFKNFLMDMGRRPSNNHSLERKNVHKNYTPSNCVWATPDIQAANKTTTVRLIVSGVEVHQAKLARQLGVTPHAIEYHIDRGKNGDQIVNYFKNK